MQNITTRYFLLMPSGSPWGIAMKTDSRGRLEDLAGMLDLRRFGGKHNYYQADMNVDIFGKSLGYKDVIRLRVRHNASIEIIRQPSCCASLGEVYRNEAMASALKIKQIKGYYLGILPVPQHELNFSNQIY